MSANNALVALATTLTLFSGAAVMADRSHDDDFGMHGKAPFSFALIGDVPYGVAPGADYPPVDALIADINHDRKLRWVMHAGDIKSGSSECSDAMFADRLARFAAFDKPVIYTPGDNEWTDCHRTSNGSYDPIERLGFLRTTFFSKNTTQGMDPITVERQGELGQAYSENSRFVKSNVEFVALHIPGSNNNLVVTEKQCTKKSNRTQADCDAATAEYQARNAKNIEWLKASFAKAREQHLAGVLIAIQADIYRIELSDGAYQDDFLPSLNADNGFSDFFHTLVEETHNFDGQVVLVHGDSHYFRVDKAMYNDDGTLTSNFTRVEVFGSSDNSWVEMTVDPSSENVFSFKPVVLH